jgi:hypothetical protein
VVIPRLLVQDGKVFFQSGIRFASLKELFRFVESLGDVRHQELSWRFPGRAVRKLRSCPFILCGIYRWLNNHGRT